MSERLTFKTAGYSTLGELHFSAGPTMCGTITDGVLLEHDREGGWVVDFKDLKAMYEAAAKVRGEEFDIGGSPE